MSWFDLSHHSLAYRMWPDSFDLFVMAVGVVATLVLVSLGHWFMVLDIRAYFRALRGVLVRVAYCFPTLPEWARYETPPCLRAMGLHWPCTADDVKTAYRRLAERHHPDRGGDPRKFHLLQRHFEVAFDFVRQHDVDDDENEDAS